MTVFRRPRRARASREYRSGSTTVAIRMLKTMSLPTAGSLLDHDHVTALEREVNRGGVGACEPVEREADTHR